jgi:hypothetical protein
MIRTDGVSCNIIFKRLIDGKMIQSHTKESHYWEKKLDPKNCSYKYIENSLLLPENIKTAKDKKIHKDLIKRKIITIDPGKSDIIHSISKSTDGTISKYRYTNAQKKHQSKTSKYAKIKEKFAQTTTINNKTIKEYEKELSEYNSKSCKLNNFKQYARKKRELNDKLKEYYGNYMFRKFRLNIYINSERGYEKMLTNFKKVHGEPDDTLIVFGDYSNNHKAGNDPVPCKKIKKLLTRTNYKLYEIDEFNTSKICNKCGENNNKFLYKTHKSGKNEGKQYLCWGLVRCTNVICNQVHNRDTNACLNMLNICDKLKTKSKRPKAFINTYINNSLHVL